MFGHLKERFFADELSRNATTQMAHVQVTDMSPSERYEYHIAELRWRMMPSLSPQSHYDEIRAVGQAAMAELRLKYGHLLPPETS